VALSGSDLLDLDKIADVVDPTERRSALLRKLEFVYQTAVGRVRTFKGEATPDPDCNGAVAALREAITLLTIDPITRKPEGSTLGSRFERKLESVK